MDKQTKCSCGEQFWESEGSESYYSNKIICPSCTDKEAEEFAKEMEIKNLTKTIEHCKKRLTDLGVAI